MSQGTSSSAANKMLFARYAEARMKKNSTQPPSSSPSSLPSQLQQSQAQHPNFNPNVFLNDSDESEPEDIHLNLKKEPSTSLNAKVNLILPSKVAKKHLPNLSVHLPVDKKNWIQFFQSTYFIANTQKVATLYKLAGTRHARAIVKRKPIKIIITDSQMRRERSYYFDCPPTLERVDQVSDLTFKEMLDDFVDEIFQQEKAQSNGERTRPQYVVYKSERYIQGGDAVITGLKDSDSNGILFRITYLSNHQAFDQFIERRRFLSAGLINGDGDLAAINFEYAIDLFFGDRDITTPPSIPSIQLSNEHATRLLDNSTQINGQLGQPVYTSKIDCTQTNLRSIFQSIRPDMLILVMSMSIALITMIIAISS